MNSSRVRCWVAVLQTFQQVRLASDCPWDSTCHRALRRNGSRVPPAWPSVAVWWQGAPAGHLLHTSFWRAESSRASLARVHLPAYTRPYSVLPAQHQGYATHIRYREPRRKLARTGNWTLLPRKRGRRGSESVRRQSIGSWRSRSCTYTLL